MGNTESGSKESLSKFYVDNKPQKSFIPNGSKSTQEIVEFLETCIHDTGMKLQEMKLSQDFQWNGRDRVRRLLAEKERDIKHFREQMRTVEIDASTALSTSQEVAYRESHTLVNSLKDNNESLEFTIECLSSKLKKLQISLDEVTEQKEQLLNRLSKIAGQKLTEDNPSVSDLSDINRPTKLSEVYSEIYDNEWTDAFEELKNGGYSEEEAIQTLRLTLVNVVQFCQVKSKTLLQKMEETLDILFKEFTAHGKMGSRRTLTRKELEKRISIIKEKQGADIVLQQRWKSRLKSEADCEKYTSSIKVRTPEVVSGQLKKFRKDVAESVLPLVQRAYMTASWSEDCIPALKPYIKKCLFLGWMMAVQSPPLVLSTCQSSAKFDKDMYKEYTQSGQTVDYVVWPALLLHEKGPLLGKGVAQGKKT